MIDINSIENQILSGEHNMSEGEHSLAYMLLAEVKTSARRWFIIALVEGDVGDNICRLPIL